MKILVVDVAADTSGAQSIVWHFCSEFKRHTENTYYFCLSVADAGDADNITVLRFPYVKKSWVHRLYFDYIVAPFLVKKYDIDYVISLQNTLIPVKISQTLYLHQPLPFVEHRFSLFKSPQLWVYQNVISKLIYKSISKAEKVVVQTNWMKEAVLATERSSVEKISVEPPRWEPKQVYHFSEDLWDKSFFYPATSHEYKNHYLLFRALILLAKKEISVKVLLTITPDQLTKECKRLLPEVHDMLTFTGSLSHNEVMRRYSLSALVFPSYVETYGLPLLEARMSNTYILASDCPFSREVLSGYNRARFFDPFNAQALANQMMLFLENKVKDIEW